MTLNFCSKSKKTFNNSKYNTLHKTAYLEVDDFGFGKENDIYA